jgi:hypothetical protein
MFNDLERQMLVNASSGLHAETFDSLDTKEQEKQFLKEVDDVINKLKEIK